MVALQEGVSGPAKAKRRRRPLWAAAAVVASAVTFGVVFAAAGGSGSREVSSADVQPWPFTVAAGLLACDGGAVTFTAGGVKYGLNGTAVDRGFPAAGPIWADDPDVAGLKVSMQAVIERGLREC